jgi:hypothetical protein
MMRNMTASDFGTRKTWSIVSATRDPVQLPAVQIGSETSIGLHLVPDRVLQ